MSAPDEPRKCAIAPAPSRRVEEHWERTGTRVTNIDAANPARLVREAYALQELTGGLAFEWLGFDDLDQVKRLHATGHALASEFLLQLQRREMLAELRQLASGLRSRSDRCVEIWDRYAGTSEHDKPTRVAGKAQAYKHSEALLTDTIDRLAADDG